MFFQVRQAAVWFLLYLVNLAISVIFNDVFVSNGQLVVDHILSDDVKNPVNLDLDEQTGLLYVVESTKRVKVFHFWPYRIFGRCLLLYVKV